MDGAWDMFHAAHIETLKVFCPTQSVLLLLAKFEELVDCSELRRLFARWSARVCSSRDIYTCKYLHVFFSIDPTMIFVTHTYLLATRRLRYFVAMLL